MHPSGVVHAPGMIARGEGVIPLWYYQSYLVQLIIMNEYLSERKWILNKINFSLNIWFETAYILESRGTFAARCRDIILVPRLGD